MWTQLALIKATIEAIKFDAKISAQNMTVDSAEKRHMLRAAVTHYDNVTTSLLELRRRGVDEKVSRKRSGPLC